MKFADMNEAIVHCAGRSVFAINITYETEVCSTKFTYAVFDNEVDAVSFGQGIWNAYSDDAKNHYTIEIEQDNIGMNEEILSRFAVATWHNFVKV